MTESPPGSPHPRPPLPSAIGEDRVIAVLRSSSPEHLDAVVDLLVEEGFTALELALTTPAALKHLKQLRTRLGEAACVGAGTVITIADASAAIDAGAEFLLAPGVCADACDFAVRQGVPYVSGAFTATEAIAGWQAGASAIKLFPANLLGPEVATALRAPLPELEFVPTGGIDSDSAPRWIARGCLAVGVGSPLLGDALETGDLLALRRRARTLRQKVPRSRPLRSDAVQENRDVAR